jgi:uncharacterized membrane protein YeaQ/YmgE (transglycosylase-associated protein family)
LDNHHWFYRWGDCQVPYALLGIVGAFVATYLGQSVGWYQPGESAGFFGGIVGAVVVLFIYGLFAGRQGRAY